MPKVGALVIYVYVKPLAWFQSRSDLTTEFAVFEILVSSHKSHCFCQCLLREFPMLNTFQYVFQQILSTVF